MEIGFQNLRQDISEIYADLEKSGMEEVGAVAPTASGHCPLEALFRKSSVKASAHTDRVMKRKKRKDAVTFLRPQLTAMGCVSGSCDVISMKSGEATDRTVSRLLYTLFYRDLPT
jgi:hypothetical protein